MIRAVPIVTAQTDSTSAPAIATNAIDRAHLLPGSDLTDAHLGSLAQRWITPELARQMQVRSIISDQGAEILGRRPASGDYGGILIPNIRPGQLGPRGYRIRRDHPDIQYKSDGTHRVANKYLSARGDRNMLYFMPSTDAAALGDATLALVVTEGEFKCAALWRLARHGVLPADPRPRFLPCALQGVSNWLGKTGKTPGPDGEAHDVKGPIPDLDQIVWTDRRVVIVFDVDVRTKEDVAGARRKLTHELQGRGAKVFWANLPAEPGVKGIDDLLYRKGPELAVYLIDHARPAACSVSAEP